MATNYYVEAKFGAKWVLITSFKRQVDALHYVKERAVEHSRNPIRVIRCVRSIVFDGSQK